MTYTALNESPLPRCRIYETGIAPLDRATGLGGLVRGGLSVLLSEDIPALYLLAGHLSYRVTRNQGASAFVTPSFRTLPAATVRIASISPGALLARNDHGCLEQLTILVQKNLDLVLFESPEDFDVEASVRQQFTSLMQRLFFSDTMALCLADPAQARTSGTFANLALEWARTVVHLECQRNGRGHLQSMTLGITQRGLRPFHSQVQLYPHTFTQGMT